MIQVAEQRMGRSAELLSRLLVAAYNEAVPADTDPAEFCKGIADIDHDKAQTLAILNYKRADYLTTEAQPRQDENYLNLPDKKATKILMP